jgi:transcription initiation factor TFIIB
VYEERTVDRGPEWRSFSDDSSENNSRVGASLSEQYHDRGLSTDIGWYNDGTGSTLSKKKQKHISRLRRQHKQAQTKNSKDRGLRFGLGEIQRMGSALGLPDSVLEVACVIFRQYHQQGKLSCAIESVAAASLYAAAKQNNCPRTLSDIYPVCRGVSDDGSVKDAKSRIGATYQKICNHLGLEIEPTQPETFFDPLFSQLSLDNEAEVRMRSHELLENFREANLHSGREPINIAAGVIYCACNVYGGGVNQETIAAVADISVVSVRNRYQEVVSVSDIDRSDVVPEKSIY